jgi:hypothetical protein
MPAEGVAEVAREYKRVPEKGQRLRADERWM